MRFFARETSQGFEVRVIAPCRGDVFQKPEVMSEFKALPTPDSVGHREEFGAETLLRSV